MEFRFNVNEVFKYPIVEINSSLIPPGLSLADKRALWDAVGKVSDVVNIMGEASATAQGLTKPITTSERLRNSEHKLYLLIDQNANNGKGAVTGMLKTGKKGLYVFDRDGHHFQVQPACVLDFYIHESKQRMGLGKTLYEYMLDKEQTEPVRMAIDRPSDKLLGFLNKHYGLNNPVRQMNNFVVYDGFFPERKDGSGDNNNAMAMGKGTQPANGLQTNFTSPYGRYGAPRPPCSMGQIIHNQSSLAAPTQEAGGTSLCIRSPTKTRSANVGSNRQEMYSSGNQQICQSMPNIWNQNPNAYNDQKQMQDTLQQQASNDYCSVPSGSPTSQNQQQYNTLPQFKYNQGPYYPSHYVGQKHLNVTQQPQLYNQTNASIPQDTELQQANIYQQQQYVSAQNENQRKSVQFTTTPQTIQQANYHPPMYTQSAHDQRYMQQPTPTNQTVSSPNIPPQSNQLYQPNVININPNTQYTQQQTKQEQQNIPNLSQFQQQQPSYVQQPQLHQDICPPQQTQSAQMVYQPQQMLYLPEQQRVTSVSQDNRQVQQQYLSNAETNIHRGERNLEKLQPIQNTNNQYTYSDPNINTQLQTTSEREIPNQTHPTKGVMSQPNYPNNQQQQGVYYQGDASMNNIQYQNPSNYQIPQTPLLNQQPVSNQQQIMNQRPITPARNMTNYQQMQSQPAQITPMYNQAQYSQPNIPPQQIYSQVKQPINPCAIIPPVEAMDTQNQMGKSYQYYDSNAGRMQNMTGEILKQSPVNEPATLPNASGDDTGNVENVENAENAENVEAEPKTPIEEPPPPQPKLERPQSLSLQTSEDIEGDEEVKGEVRPQHVHTKSNFDIVEDIKKLTVGQNQATPTPKTPDKGDGEGTKKTPSHLTEQGFFDLKFYHNKLW